MQDLVNIAAEWNDGNAQDHRTMCCVRTGPSDEAGRPCPLPKLLVWCRSSLGRQLGSPRRRPGERGRPPGGCCCGASATAVRPSSSGASGLRRERTCSQWSCAGEAPLDMFQGQPCAHDHHIDTAFFGMGLDPQNGVERSVVTRICLNAALLEVASPSAHTTYPAGRHQARQSATQLEGASKEAYSRLSSREVGALNLQGAVRAARSRSPALLGSLQAGD